MSDSFACGSGRVMLAAHQNHRFPAQGALLVDVGEGAVDKAAVQRQRMIRMCGIRIASDPSGSGSALTLLGN